MASSDAQPEPPSTTAWISQDSEKSSAAGAVPSSCMSRTRNHLLETVRPSTLAEIQLLILTFTTGIQDAIAFPDYHCFASNQTGNTIFLAVAIILPELNGDMFFTANIAVALGLFLAGGYLTGQVGNLVGPRLRLWLVLSNLAQTLLVFAAGIIQQTRGVAPTGPASLVAIALLAFASGSQVVQSRSLRVMEITTAMATAAWVDLLIDPRLLAVREPNRPRNRRIAFLFSLVVGSLVGAGMYKTVGSAAAAFLSAGGKAVVTFMYLFNEGEKDKEGGTAV